MKTNHVSFHERNPTELHGNNDMLVKMYKHNIQVKNNNDNYITITITLYILHNYIKLGITWSTLVSENCITNIASIMI